MIAIIERFCWQNRIEFGYGRDWKSWLEAFPRSLFVETGRPKAGETEGILHFRGVTDDERATLEGELKRDGAIVSRRGAVTRVVAKIRRPWGESGGYVQPTPPAPTMEPFYFEGRQDGSAVRVKGSEMIPDLQYSYDRVTWTDWPYTPSGTTYNYDVIMLDAGDRLYVRGNNSTLYQDNWTYVRFMGLGKVAAVGNIQYLATRDGNSLTAICMRELFKDMTSLVGAPLLPATTLVAVCYAGMFWNCTSLAALPAEFTLPATALTVSCYDYMFNGCSSLAALPAGFTLPATTLAASCYNGMFQNCSSLAALPAGFTLPATTLTDHCYSFMFSDCSSLAALPAGFTLPATTLEQYCYFGMFQYCSSLAALPAGFTLPATTLEPYCYANMFMGCGSLAAIPAGFSLPAASLANSSNAYMFSSTAATMSADGSTFAFPVGLTFPYTDPNGNYATPKDFARHMGNTRGFN